MRLVLAGAAGVGKTTTARVLAQLLGLPYRPVEAPECWQHSEAAVRQLCFACSFARRLGYDGALGVPRAAGVYDNSMLSVYAYTKALSFTFSPALYGLAMAALTLGLREASHVVLAAEPETLQERIAKRLETEPTRKQNTIEKCIQLHAEAQKHLLQIAEVNNIPVVYTDSKTPEQLAKEIAEITKVKRYADS